MVRANMFRPLSGELTTRPSHFPNSETKAETVALASP